MFQEIKKIVLASVLIVMASLTNAMAFDLEDYRDTYRQTKDMYDHSLNRLIEKEANYKAAFKARLDMEKAVRAQEKIEYLAADPVDPNLVGLVDNELDKLSNLEGLSQSCGL